ncbi:hypothetical protein BKN14_02620 [Candidatus Gracilibacteria bacterium HOT-871]|nr:hypothetical protein BKN14_02620 [Candidatus Gracilibacteria bacterium HOT-871]
MNFTSHFVGISLKVELFENIFEKIKNIFGKNLQKIIELQSMDSLHITLYYLPKKLKNSDFQKIEKIISEIDIDFGKINVKELNYFGKNIAYLSFENTEQLDKINNIFKNNFPKYNKIIDNSYNNFIAHTTIFKIKNYKKFLEHKAKVEKTFSEEISKLTKENIFGNIHIYAVSSNTSPEFQKIIN